MILRVNSCDVVLAINDDDMCADIGKIVPIKKIGQGSFGYVYLAESSQLGQVAIKQMPAEGENLEKMLAEFRKEIDIMK